MARAVRAVKRIEIRLDVAVDFLLNSGGRTVRKTGRTDSLSVPFASVRRATHREINIFL